jgi:hypothetical protein
MSPISLIDINRNTKRFPQVPESFDVENAARSDLYTYGLPPRPDRNDYPDLYNFWLELVEPPLQRVDVQFELYPQDDNALRTGGFRSNSRQQSSRNWSGVSMTPRDGRMFTEVAGAWHVPTVSAPADGHYRSSTWIGLDGQRSYLDATLPQIGTAQRVTLTGSLSVLETRAWVQWYPEISELFIPNMGFSPGHRAAAYVTVLPPATPGGPQRVFMFLTNLSIQNQFGFHPYAAFEWNVPPTAWPDPATSPLLQPEVAGGTVEWVMERPTREGTDELRNFPDYNQVVFEPCFGLTAHRPGEIGRLEEFTGPSLMRMSTDGRIPNQAVVVSRTERSKLKELVYTTSPFPP